MILTHRLLRRPWLLATGVVVLAALLAYAAWLGLSARSALLQAREDAQHLRASLKAGDQKRAEADLASLRKHAGTAHSRTSNPVWSAVGIVPFVGDDARAVATASRVVDEVADAAAPVIDRGGLDADRFAPRKGAVDLAAMTSLRAPLGHAAAALNAGRADVDAVDAGDLIGGFAADWRDFAGEVDDAASAVDAAYRATEVAPVLFGADGPSRTLLVFDTPAEPRATGGMPGSIAELDADHGRLQLGRQRAASDFPVLAKPVLPLSHEEEVRFGPELGEYVMDAAFTPHFPRTAELIAARWQREYHQQIDGVVAIDPVALGYLLEATGPVTVGSVTLTSENLAGYLMHQVYVDIAAPAAQDLFFQAVAGTVFDRIRSGDVDSEKLLTAATRAVDERRIFVHATAPAVQEHLAGTSVAGEVTEDPKAAPQVGAYVNDATGSKMGWFLDYDVKVTGSCSDEGRTLTGTMTLHSTLKPGEKLPTYITGSGQYGVPPGEHLVSVELMGPQGGTLSGITFDGEKQPDAEITPYRTHRMTSVAVFLDPGATHTIGWSMTTHGRGPVSVDVGAGVRPEDESSSLPAC